MTRTDKHTNRRRGDGGTASEGLEAGVNDIPGLLVHLDLQLHDISTCRSAHQARSNSGIVLVE
jgi:hypothetical protein